MKVPITRPSLGEEELNLVGEVLKSGWVVQGPMVEEFERLFGAFTGSRYAVATTSCTTALHLSLLASGVGPGDEVIVPSFTYVATANSIEYTGARPVFVDIDSDTFNIDVNDAQEKITEKTRAIIPVHLFGVCADMDAVLSIAKDNGLKVVEDAACAMGSLYKGVHAGTMGLAGCFSFHPRKAITTGEGGMITTGEEEFAELVARLRDHGATRSDLERASSGASLLPDHPVLGFNYRMTDLQGALGVAQMKKADSIIEARRQAAARYDTLLGAIKWLKTPKVPNGLTHSYQSYVCVIDKDAFGGDADKACTFRGRLMERLEDKGVSTRQGTHAVHRLTYYKDKYSLSDSECLRSLEAEMLTLTLPLYAQMSDAEQDFVVEGLFSTGEELI